MFGYVKTDFPNLYVKDTVLYKAVYCGLCKSIGKSCGTNGRFLLNYDLTFYSVFAHNILGVDFIVKKQHCILHPITKRPIAVYDELSERIAALNVILGYYKLSDNVIDNGRGRLRRSFFTCSYKKAVKAEPCFDRIVRERFNELLQIEKKQSAIIDEAADPFANLLKDVSAEIFKDKYNENLERFCYNLGKWVYLIDALDDFDKDKKKGSYNVFANVYKDVSDKATLLNQKKEELQNVFGSVLSQIYSSAKTFNYKFNHDLTDNIIYKGLFVQTKSVMENAKCKNSTRS